MKIIQIIISILLSPLILLFFIGYNIYSFFQVYHKDEEKYRITLTDGTVYNDIHLLEIRWNKVYFYFFHENGKREKQSVPLRKFLCGSGGPYTFGPDGIERPKEPYYSYKSFTNFDE